MRCAMPGSRPSWVNCNPETVSTDYDTSDRLYFEPLTEEDVISLIRREQQQNGTVLGCIVQYGGQSPIEAVAGAIAGQNSHPRHLGRCDRPGRGPANAFNNCCNRLGRAKPDNGIARSAEAAEGIAERIGYPVVIRPSYVLGGRAMEIVYDAPVCIATCAKRYACRAKIRC